MTSWLVQFWHTCLALARAWRWRGFAMAAPFVAWWLSRQPGFSEGSMTWFPMGEEGIIWVTCFLAAGAAVLGVDCVGQWDRHRARPILDARLLHPLRFVVARWLGVTLLSMVPAFLATFWAPVGAWRAGLEVEWLPSVLYLILCAFPVVAVAGAAGISARALFPSDAPALILAGLLAGPMMYYRLSAAPISEVFLLTSESLGVLVPRGLLLREGLVSLGFAVPWLALAALLLPRPRPAGVCRPRGLVRHLQPVLLLEALQRLALRRRQAGLPRHGVLLLAFLLIVPLMAEPLALFRDRPRPMDWFAATEPAGTVGGRIPAAEILHRSITLPGEPAGEIVITLTLAVEEETRLAALTFGDHLDLLEARVGNAPAAVLEGAASPGAPYRVLRLPGEADGNPVELTCRLAPRKSSLRLWERAWHRRFHRFSFLGPWYGETASLDYAFQQAGTARGRSPFEIDAPNPAPLAWSAGAARSRMAPGGRVVISDDRSGRPDRLVAGELMELDLGQQRHLPLTARVLPGHAPLVRQFSTIFGEQLERLAAIFGEDIRPAVLYEVPEANPADPLALSSSALDRLVLLLPRFDHFREPTRGQFFAFFEPIHRGLVEEAVETNFAHIESPEILRDGLITFLHEHGLSRGQTAGMRRRIRREVVLIPWAFVRGSATRFIIRQGETAGWEGPLPRESRPSELAPVHPDRPVALHHLLRGTLGEEPFEVFLRRLFADLRGEALTLEAYRAIAEEVHGESLDWFFHQWVEVGVVPAGRIRRGQAFLFEDPGTRSLNYRVVVEVENRGTGRVPIPWALATEGETVRGEVRLGPGEIRELEIDALARPIAFELDPRGWIPQRLPPAEEGREEARPRILFRTVTEL